MRQELGEILLAAEKYAAAAEAFRQDLERFPGNGWSLYGLARAERALGNSREAAELERRFRDVWEEADINLAQ